MSVMTYLQALCGTLKPGLTVLGGRRARMARSAGMMSVFPNKRTGGKARLNRNNDFGWVALFRNRELEQQRASIAY